MNAPVTIAGIAAPDSTYTRKAVRRNPIRAAGTGLVDIGHRHVHGFHLPNGCDLLDNAVLETWHKRHNAA